MESNMKQEIPPAGSQTLTVPKEQKEKKTPQEIQRSPQKPNIFKIIVIGDSNVGKTCLTYRFCSGKFPDRVEATIGVDFREKVVELEGEKIKLQLWDTAGQERFRKSMVQHYYRNVQAVVFVYDVTKQSSFEGLVHWIEECNKHQLTPEIPRVMVGNKCDAPASDVVVSTHRAQRFADAHSMPLFETSAKDDSLCNHVESIFYTLAHKLRASKPMISSPYRYVNSDAPSMPSSQDATIKLTTHIDVTPDGDSSCFC